MRSKVVTFSVMLSAVLLLCAAKQEADQSHVQVKPQHDGKTVEAIQDLTRQICDIYPDVPCVLDKAQH